MAAGAELFESITKRRRVGAFGPRVTREASGRGTREEIGLIA